MCGEDGIKRAVYNMREKHAEARRNIERNREKTEKENLERKELYWFQRKTNCYSGSDPSINGRLNLFASRKVNLVIEHPCSTNYIVRSPNVLIQYHFGIVTNRVLTVDLSKFTSN